MKIGVKTKCIIIHVDFSTHTSRPYFKIDQILISSLHMGSFFPTPPPLFFSFFDIKILVKLNKKLVKLVEFTYKIKQIPMSCFFAGNYGTSHIQIQTQK